MFKMIKQSIVCAILKELIKMKKSMTSFCTLKRLYFFSKSDNFLFYYSSTESAHRVDFFFIPYHFGLVLYVKAHYCLPKFVTLSPFLKLAFHHDTNEHSRKASGPISSVCLLCSLQASHHEVFLQNTTVCTCGGFLTLFF